MKIHHFTNWKNKQTGEKLEVYYLYGETYLSLEKFNPCKNCENQSVCESQCEDYNNRATDLMVKLL